MHEGQWLKHKILRQKMTISAFQKKTGISRSQLNKWFTMPVLSIRVDLIWVIIDTLGLTEFVEKIGHNRTGAELHPLQHYHTVKHVFSDIIEAEGGATNDAPPRRAVGTADPVQPKIIQQLEEIPMFDASVAAGPWADVSDICETWNPASIQQGLFRIRCSGQSMEKEWPNGTIVEFERVRFDVHSLQVGDDYYVQKDDGMATFKRLEKATETAFTLRAINKKKYPEPMIVDPSTIVQMAIAVGQFTPKKRRIHE